MLKLQYDTLSHSLDEKKLFLPFSMNIKIISNEDKNIFICTHLVYRIFSIFFCLSLLRIV